MLGAAEKLQLVEAEEVQETKAPKGYDFSRLTRSSGDVPSAIRLFLTGEGRLGRNSMYRIRDGELWVWRTTSKNKVKDCLARKINGVIVGNSSALSINAKGEYSRGALMIQLELARLIPMVPYGMFEETGHDIEKLKIIERGPEEKFYLGRNDHYTKEKIYEHFTGAMLFSIGKDCFLFDVDRNDIKEKVLNPWLSKLPKMCKTIADAYASLKPMEVYDAERFLGHECQRHGEWFFIPVQGEFKPTKKGGTYNEGFIEASLQSKGNRPHYAARISEEGFVTGRVRHGGYEHKDLILKGWHRPVPNTAIKSWTIAGKID